MILELGILGSFLNWLGIYSGYSPQVTSSIINSLYLIEILVFIMEIISIAGILYYYYKAKRLAKEVKDLKEELQHEKERKEAQADKEELLNKITQIVSSGNNKN